MNGISCPSAEHLLRGRRAGTILKTTNGGQTWPAQTSGTTNALNGIACFRRTGALRWRGAGAARASRTTAPLEPATPARTR